MTTMRDLWRRLQALEATGPAKRDAVIFANGMDQAEVDQAVADAHAAGQTPIVFLAPRPDRRNPRSVIDLSEPQTGPGDESDLAP